jgi:pyocin large subunit-like protein
LADHFDRHGRDFRAASAEDYAAQAWLFLVRACAEGLPAKQDSDGVVRVFDPGSGAFGAYNRDGTTKTYFKPGRRGYFEDQPGEPVNLRNLKQFRPPQ